MKYDSISTASKSAIEGISKGKSSVECGRAGPLAGRIHCLGAGQHQTEIPGIVVNMFFFSRGRNFHPKGDGGSGRRPLPPDT